MLSWIVLILVLAAFSIIGVRVFASVFGRGEELPPMPPTEEVKAANRRAIAEGNFGDIQLEVVQRGYRMDQVDALIAQLTGQEDLERPAAAATAEPAARAATTEPPRAGEPVDAAAEPRTRVESSTTDVSTEEGALTHGSDETANR